MGAVVAPKTLDVLDGEPYCEGDGEEAPVDAEVILTAAQFIFSSCSRLYQIHAKICNPVGRSLGTVKLKS